MLYPIRELELKVTHIGELAPRVGVTDQYKVLHIRHLLDLFDKVADARRNIDAFSNDHRNDNDLIDLADEVVRESSLSANRDSIKLFGNLRAVKEGSSTIDADVILWLSEYCADILPSASAFLEDTFVKIVQLQGLA